MVEVLVRKKIDSEETLGKFISNNYYDRVIESDCDLYAWNQTNENNEDNIIFKYRKNVFTKEECDAAYAGLREAATESQNRGKAAGPRGEQLGQEGRSNRDWVTPEQSAILKFLARPLNTLEDGTTLEIIRESSKNSHKEETRGQVWLRSEVTEVYPEYHGWFEKWLLGIHNTSREEQMNAARHILQNWISETNYAQSVMSGIAGYFDRYPRLPYGRATAYTEDNPDKFALCYPYLHKLNDQFRELIPARWKAQNEQASRLDDRFRIDGTVFTTLTINHNWRTACHRDAGDLTAGFSNICGVTGPEGKGWRGGQFILPEYRIAINLQPGDMLLVNNHGGIHGNDELIGEDNDRMTIVAYFREKMINLKSWEYENLRHQYVVDRRTNKDHPLHRPLWNGVSPKMWEEQEWAGYLEAHGMTDEDGIVKVGKQHSLEDFFG
jgi:hypothetical protein